MVSALRGRAAAATPIVAALVLLAAAGCGSGSRTVTPQAPATSAGPGSGAAAAAGTHLKVVFNDGAGKSTTWSLTCTPSGGTLPDPATACALLAAAGTAVAMAPVAKNLMCAQIYSGAQTAQVSGSWAGKPVTASFSRKNGCETSRWNALVGLLPAATGGAT